MYNICFEFGLNQRFQVYLTKHLQEAIYQIDETTLMISGPEETETKEHQDNAFKTDVNYQTVIIYLNYVKQYLRALT